MLPVDYGSGHSCTGFTTPMNKARAEESPVLLFSNVRYGTDRGKAMQADL